MKYPKVEFNQDWGHHSPTELGHIRGRKGRQAGFQEFKSESESDDDEVGQISATAFEPEAERGETPAPPLTSDFTQSPEV